LLGAAQNFSACQQPDNKKPAEAGYFTISLICVFQLQAATTKAPNPGIGTGIEQRH